MEMETFDIRLKHDSAMVICGPSGSGKTELLKRLITFRNELFDKVPKRIVWFYGIYQESLTTFMEEHAIVTHRGLPNDLETFLQPGDMVIFDDLQSQMRNSDAITDVFTRLAHHLPCFAVFLVQHLFYKSRDSTTRSLSTNYLIVLKNIRSTTIICTCRANVS